MEIEKVIEIFEKCIPYYQKAVDEEWYYHQLIAKNMQFGICCFTRETLNISVSSLFVTSTEGHYHNFKNKDYYLFGTANEYMFNADNITNNCIIPRLNFLKTEVKRLKRLQKQGYTHI